MKNFRAEYLLSGQLDSFRENVLYADEKPAFSYRKFEKKDTGLFYKLVSVISLIYILFIQINAFRQDNPAAVGMVYLTVFFIGFSFINWLRPLIKINELGSILPPRLLMKLIKQYPGENKISKFTIIKVIAKRAVFFTVLIASVLILFEYGKINSNFVYGGNFWENFVSDALFVGNELSPNIFLNYLLIIIALCSFLTTFNNPFYCYERILIKRKLEKRKPFASVILIFAAIVLLALLSYDQSEYQLYLIKSLNEIYLGLIAVLAYLISFMSSCLYFHLILKKACNKK